jgi:predicted TPR repeat methyltransferase
MALRYVISALEKGRARPRERQTMAAQPLFVSSGDLLADRRYQWALDYLQRGEADAAADILVQVLETAHRFATAWFALASIREAQGDRDGAIAAFTAARDADGEDYHGARLHLARLGVGEATPAMTGVYVRRLFDQHAPDFDTALVERLEYRGPELLLEAVRSIKGAPLRLGSVLDLGCGTGLGGAAFRPWCDWLVGVDVSPGMIEQARAKGLYDALAAAELLEFLAADAASSYDLVLAADVFVYCSDLAPIAKAVARVLVPGGLFAFTVETHDGLGALMQPTLRYAHGAEHVRDAIAGAGLALRQLAAVSTRTEKGEPVPGLLVIASLPPPSPPN